MISSTAFLSVVEFTASDVTVSPARTTTRTDFWLVVLQGMVPKF